MDGFFGVVVPQRAAGSNMPAVQFPTEFVSTDLNSPVGGRGSAREMHRGPFPADGARKPVRRTVLKHCGNKTSLFMFSITSC